MALVDVDDLGQDSPTPARSAGIVGVASAGLLVACLLWAHHWGLLADLLVAGWAAATVSALGLSIWSLRESASGRAFAKVGLTLALISVLALVGAGLAFAAGGDPTGACGGG